MSEPLPGLKPGASGLLHGWVSLVLDVGFDASFGDLTHRLGEIAVSPEAVAPQELIQLGELSADDLAGTAFH